MKKYVLMAEKLRALIVDDEEAYRRFFKRSLERRGFYVCVASNPAEADRTLDGEKFDVIVLDILMPGETGVSLLKRIKRKDPFSEIILISGHATVESAIDALRGGATDYIEKPFTDSEQVLATIERAAQRRRYRTGPWDILLISPDQGDAPAVVNALKPHGVVVVETADDAFQFLSNRVFHLILLSLDRRNAGSLDMLDETLQRYPTIPVIVLTASDDNEIAVRAIEMGAENFVRKDGLETDLAQCVVDVLDPNRSVLPSVRADEVDALIGPTGALRFVSSGDSFYRLLINSMAEACFVIDRTGTITFSNDALETICGLDKDQVLGWKGYHLFSDASRPRLQKIFESLTGETESRTYGAEVELKSAHGPPIPVLLRGTSLHASDGSFEASFVLMTDIREQKERERRLQELVTMQNDFVSMTSHELNTPLAVIAGSLSLLSEKVFGDLTEQQSKHMAIVERNVGRLQRLVRDLLDISRIDSGRLTLQPALIDLRTPILSACQSLLSIAQERGVRLVFPGAEAAPVKAIVDPDRIEQVIINLVNNATRFAAGTVEVRVEEVVDSHDPRVRIVVEDDGPGIAEADKANLFKKFYRGQKSAQAGKGTGLGLSIVRGIVESHGGHVSVDNRAEGGSRFCVELPRSPLPDLSRPKKQAAGAAQLP